MNFSSILTLASLKFKDWLFSLFILNETILNISFLIQLHRKQSAILIITLRYSSISYYDKKLNDGSS